jgi:sorting nexin-5/6/32
MVDWEAACRAVDKARPNREEAAKTVRNEAEKEFLDCSEVSKAEIKAFHQRRLSEFRQALLYYVEGQVKCYRDNQAALTNCLNKMKDFKLPELKDSMFDPNDNDK